MTTNQPDDPLKIILGFNQTTLKFLDRIQISTDNQSVKTQSSSNNQDIQLNIIDGWFSISCPKLNRALELKFFPAMLESMAGSDAICIKGMTNNYIDSCKKLGHQWQQSIYKVMQQLPANNIEQEKIRSWIEQYKQAIALCNEEIMPMADRLLDATTMQELGLYFGRLHTGLSN